MNSYKHLRERMYEFHFNMYPFAFNYHGNRFFVAAYVITEEERSKCPQYTLFRLVFMRRQNLDDIYELYMNSRDILEFNPTELRNYFDVEFDPNGYGFMDAFCHALSIQCPPDVETIEDEELVRVERHITYCFTANQDEEVPEDLAIERFIQNEQKRRN